MESINFARHHSRQFHPKCGSNPLRKGSVEFADSTRKEITVPEGLPRSRPRSPAQEPLVVALARAFHWQDLIDSGQYSSITELARALGVDRSYVGRMTRLTLLAPDIVEAIMRGIEPDGLSLGRLTKELPVEWQEQREKLGFG